jgi:C-terminal processing protease CtpA/Prc
MKSRLLTSATIGLITIFIACKKKEVPKPSAPPQASRQEQTLDSMYLYAKEIYYWNYKLPSFEDFNPRQYNVSSTDLDNYNNELLAIAKYSAPFEYSAGATSPKFSNISDKTKKNPTAYVSPKMSVDLEGNGSDVGIRYGLYGSTSNYIIYVTAVFENSPADKLGLKRGDVIKKINGTSYGTNYNAEVEPLNTALNGSSITLEGVKADGITTFSQTITKGVFKSNPIFKVKVFDTGSKKIGYLAYARFSNASNSVAALNDAFTTFSNAGVNDLIIDLRYNGGGYVSTAQHLINLIAPSTVSGVMFAEYFNATMQAGQAKIMRNQPTLDGNGKVRYNSSGEIITYADVNYTVAGNTYSFSKQGSLNQVSNIVFIVSGSTASASELVINSLKPHVNVKLVGKTTYGKPIGFFPITLENRYDVYFSLFETKNSAGQGGYYSGMTPDYDLSEVPTGTIMYDFGNANDNYTKKALDILAPGAVVNNPTGYKSNSGLALQRNQVPTAQIIQADFLEKDFKGMIENRLKLK